MFSALLPPLTSHEKPALETGRVSSFLRREMNNRAKHKANLEKVPAFVLAVFHKQLNVIDL